MVVRAWRLLAAIIAPMLTLSTKQSATDRRLADFLVSEPRRRGYTAQPRVSTPGNHPLKRFALKGREMMFGLAPFQGAVRLGPVPGVETPG
jgi:hypothetical protein